MNKKAKTIIPVAIIAILLLLIIIPYIIYGIIVAVYSGNEIKVEDLLSEVERRWDISIPKDMNLEYGYMNPDRGFHGEGETYIYIVFKNEPTDFLSDFEKSKDDIFKNSFDDGIKYIEGDIAVKSVIDWSKDYYYKSEGSHDTLHMVYFPDGMKLYILENIR